MDPELLHAARELAKKVIADDVDAGLTYGEISKKCAGIAGPGYRASVSGWLKVGECTMTVPNSKIVVYKVNGVDVGLMFSLFKIFSECQEGQLVLL
jgi:hypothetical protein